jgi:hypothetical protein
MSRWRTLSSFLVIGALVFAGRQALGLGKPERVIEVHLPAGSSSDAQRRAVDEALLVDVATRAGWLEADAVIRDRLQRNVRFALGMRGSDEALLEQALALGMHRSDRVVRQRLRDHGRRALLARHAETEPSDAALRAFLREQPEAFRAPSRVRFRQVLLSRQRRGEALDDDARARAAELARSAPSDEVVAGWGDPSLLPATVGWSDERRIDATFGAGFGAQVLAAEPGAWRGPLRSTYGVHFVRVLERRAAHTPPLASVRALVREAWLRRQRDRRVRRALDALRGDYRIEQVEGAR